MDNVISKDQQGTKEAISFYREYTLIEIAEKKTEIVKLLNELEEIEDEKKEVVTHLNEKIKARNGKSRELARALKEGGEEVVETCNKVVCREDEKVGYYDENGILVHERSITHEDLEQTLFE